MATGCCLIMT